jgi:hypothetical protein
MDSLSQDMKSRIQNLRQEKLISKITLKQFANIHTIRELHYLAHKIPSLGSVLGQMNPIHIATSHFSKNYFSTATPV